MNGPQQLWQVEGGGGIPAPPPEHPPQQQQPVPAAPPQPPPAPPPQQAAPPAPPTPSGMGGGDEGLDGTTPLTWQDAAGQVRTKTVNELIEADNRLASMGDAEQVALVHKAIGGDKAAMAKLLDLESTAPQPNVQPHAEANLSPEIMEKLSKIDMLEQTFQAERQKQEDEQRLALIQHGLQDPNVVAKIPLTAKNPRGPQMVKIVLDNIAQQYVRAGITPTMQQQQKDMYNALQFVENKERENYQMYTGQAYVPPQQPGQPQQPSVQIPDSGAGQTPMPAGQPQKQEKYSTGQLAEMMRAQRSGG